METNDLKNVDPLNAELNAASKKLEARRKALIKDGIQIVLGDILDNIDPINLDFGTLKIRQQDICNLAAKTIVKACCGRLLIPHYFLNTDKTSPIWVYTGLCWEDIGDQQIFYDFVREACMKMGLCENLVDDCSFAKKLYKVVEKKLSKFPQKQDTEGKVLIPLVNGVLCIDHEGRRTIRPHRPEDYFRYVVPFEFDEQARCPRFTKFLDEVLPDKGVQKVVLEYFAYCFVPWLHIEKLMVLLGSGSNGKSKLLDVLAGLFGKNNITHENLYDLTHDATHRANIVGKPVNLCTENQGRINASIMRTLVSGETITCKKLYSQPFETDNYAKLLFAYNEMPQIESTLANMRRWIIVKFNVYIPEEQADTDLGEKLAQELPGILNLVLSVLPDLLKRKKFSKSEEIGRAVNELEFENDPVMQFVCLRCETGSRVKIKGSDLFKGYCEFCLQNNIHNYLKNQGFYKRLEALGHRPFVENNQKMFNIRIVRYED